MLAKKTIEDEILTESNSMKNKIKIHLSKFNNIDELFLITDDIIKDYFLLQSVYKNIEEFKLYLKGEIEFYLKSFSLSRKEKDMNRLNYIDETYDKIIYFGEFNPVEARREEEMKNVPSISETLNPKTNGVIGGITGAVRKLLSGK
ncbi:MAG: hypothetical protein PHG82_00530 [Candidatus Gracilibacteria bacterium]|nr:hypothetical protein [Candidatus Gracilibacteria bacterium]